MLGFLEKLTLSPSEIAEEDTALLLKRGASANAVADAIYVCVGFNIINRLADALDVKVPPPKMFNRAARFLLAVGYQVLSGLDLEALRSLYPGNKNSRQLAICDELKVFGGKFDFYATMWNQLNAAVFESPGFLEPSLRQAAGKGEGVMPEPMSAYVKKVAQNACELTDGEIGELKQTGYSEDQIFEMTVCAALGAGRLRLESGLNALSYHFSTDKTEDINSSEKTKVDL